MKQLKNGPWFRHYRINGSIRLSVAIEPVDISPGRHYAVGMSLCCKGDSGSKVDGATLALQRSYLATQILGDAHPKPSWSDMTPKGALPRWAGRVWYLEPGTYIFDASTNNDVLRDFLRGLRRMEEDTRPSRLWHNYRKVFYGKVDGLSGHILQERLRDDIKAFISGDCRYFAVV